MAIAIISTAALVIIGSVIIFMMFKKKEEPEKKKKYSRKTNSISKNVKKVLLIDEDDNTASEREDEMGFVSKMNRNSDSAFALSNRRYDNEALNVTLTQPALICRASNTYKPNQIPVDSLIYDDRALRKGVYIGKDPSCDYYMNNSQISHKGNFFLKRTDDEFEIYELDDVTNPIHNEEGQCQSYFAFKDHVTFTISNICFEFMTPKYYMSSRTEGNSSDEKVYTSHDSAFSRAMKEKEKYRNPSGSIDDLIAESEMESAEEELEKTRAYRSTQLSETQTSDNDDEFSLDNLFASENISVYQS